MTMKLNSSNSDPENVATMHAFVDMMNFHDMQFTDALRTFLQSFRLPGEAQKIDRYMLKFAERYIACNPGVFADAGVSRVFIIIHPVANWPSQTLLTSWHSLRLC